MDTKTNEGIMSRAQFAELSEALVAFDAEWERFVGATNLAIAEVMVAEACTRKDKRRTKAYGRLGSESLAERLSAAESLVATERRVELRAPYVAVFEQGALLWGAMRKSIEAGLEALAQVAEIESGPARRFSTTYTSSYSSQGFGASSYARGSAESTVAALKHMGVVAEVRRVVPTPSAGEARSYGLSGSTYPSGERFEVWAELASEVDVAICRRKPGQTLREWVAGCWARGVNPRVYNAFLPHGYEERVGLDYQGRDVVRKAVGS